MMYSDVGVSKDCINMDSYGEICVGCGCCSRNPDYRKRVIRIIRYYKESLRREKRFNDWDKDEFWREIQEKNVASNILYDKRVIRRYKKILRTLKGKKV